MEQTHEYSVGVDAVLAAFFSDMHIKAKNEELGARNVNIIELERDDVSGKLVITREMQSSFELPGILSSFHREWNKVRQEEHWVRKDDDEWHCEFRVFIESVPVKIKGNMRLQGSESGCSNEVSVAVRCDVPLLGKKIEKFVTDDLQLKIKQEHAVNQRLI